MGSHRRWGMPSPSVPATISGWLRLGILTVSMMAVPLSLAGCLSDRPDRSGPTGSTAPAVSTTGSGAPSGGSSLTERTTGASGPSATTDPTMIAAQAGLPAAVAATREAIARAASDRDFDRLEQLALQTGSSGAKPQRPSAAQIFSFGTGDPAEGPRPGRYWREQEQKGARVLEGLVAVLGLPYVSREELEGGVYVWPDLAGIDWRNLTAEQRARLERSFSASDVAAWQKAGAYLGYRVGIGPDGRWLFFIQGE